MPRLICKECGEEAYFVVQVREEWYGKIDDPLESPFFPLSRQCWLVSIRCGCSDRPVKPQIYLGEVGEEEKFPRPEKIWRLLREQGFGNFISWQSRE